MADISTITLLNGTTYNLKDTIARQNIPFGIVDSTSTSTAFTATVPGITSLVDGTCVLLKNGVATSEANFTININGLGAKPVYSNMHAATAETTMFNVNYTMLFVYDSTRVEGGAWILYRGYNSNDNTIGYQIRTNVSSFVMADKTYRYRLLFTSADHNKWVPANTSTSTNATAVRTTNTRPIDPFGPIVYYGTTAIVNAGELPSVSALWHQHNPILGYSFNSTGAALVLTKNESVYLKCTPQANGSAVMETYTQTLPSTADGKIYIFLGVVNSTDAARIELYLYHPVYFHDGTNICLWTGPNSTITGATATPLAPGTAAVGSSTKYAREDHVHPAQVNITGNAGTVNNHTVLSDVPANAVFTDTINTYYGECLSSAYQVEKIVDCDNFTELVEGATINVLFSNVNAAVDATLNVNNTGSKKIRLHTLDGTTSDSGLNWSAGIVSFTYDGTSWRLHSPPRLASSFSSGLMSYTDKTKLDGLNKYYITSTAPSSPSNGDAWFIIEEEEEELIISEQDGQSASEPSYP